MKHRLRHAVAAGAARRLIDLVLGTARIEKQGTEHLEQFRRAGRPVIFVLWHGRLLPLSYVHRNEGIVTLVSRSTDGEIIARVLEQWGYASARGSSSRGGTAALREMVRHARAGRSLAITPDGPRGPREAMKPGVLVAAQLTGAPLIPTAAGTDRAWWFEGWDRFLVPKPFARIRVAYGPPVFVPREASEVTLARIGEELKGAVDAVTSLVDGVNHRGR